MWAHVKMVYTDQWLFTFNCTVFSSWDKFISISIQTVDGASVTVQRHVTPVCLQIPTPESVMMTGKLQNTIN